MNNYGDVALNLKPDWDRRRISNKKYALWIVGHDNGKSDAYKKADENARHQFAWIDPRYAEELAINLSSGFTYVTKAEWTMNEQLWQWNAEDKCYNQGQLLMARPAALWFAQQAEREKELAGRNDDDMDAADEIARRAGIPLQREDEAPRKARRG